MSYSKETLLDLSELANDIRLGNDGIWRPPVHTDLKFLENDETDWGMIEPNSFWYQHRNCCFEMFFNRFPPDGLVVEIGAGNGSVTLALQKMGLPIISIEPTEKCARRAKKRGVRHVVCANFEEVQLSSSINYSIGLFDVLEHIEEDGRFLRMIKERLPKGGRVYCAVPAMPWLWSCEDRIAGHYRRYTLKTLTEKMQSAGLVVDHGTYFFSFLRLPIFLLRTIPSFIRLRNRRTHDATFREHRPPTPLLANVINRLGSRELLALNNEKVVHAGASCFVVTKPLA